MFSPMPLCLSINTITQKLSLHFNGHFPGEPWLASVYWSKGWWRRWWQLDYWSHKSCKAAVKSSPPTNQHPVFLQVGCPFCRPTNSVKALKRKISHFMDLLTPSSPGGLPTLLRPLIAPGYLGGGLPCLSSAQGSIKIMIDPKWVTIGQNVITVFCKLHSKNAAELRQKII